MGDSLKKIVEIEDYGKSGNTVSVERVTLPIDKFNFLIKAFFTMREVAGGDYPLQQLEADELFEDKMKADDLLNGPHLI